MRFELARIDATHETIDIRQLTEIDEFADAVRLQREIWGFEDVELLPQRLFVVASKIGGQVLGAYDRTKMVAFCLCIPGLKSGGKFYLHSHMLGVLPLYRNTGLGRRMKLRQREYGLANGIDLIEWTFDPLEIKNAFFNIRRLGTVVRRYVYNQYGTTTSHLHGGLPTDRLVAEWWIRTPRAEAVSKQQPFQGPAAEARISVPSEIAELRERDPRRAREIQESLGEQFNRCFRAGLAVIGFEKSDCAGTYLMGPWESK
ncbi:MAG TPA: acetyltransferase [Bryobacteraceae bacterium]|jgi:predicted GNAT superfamily acetyltransferase|nr:acetyltransferase [Bryobacteraceae bacterium]